MTAAGLHVLAVDDVSPALDELCLLLREAPEVAEVTAAGDPLTALKTIRAGRFDAVFVDIAMPGLDGLELASLLAQLHRPPVIVFVTAYDGHAVSAFDIGAVDYLLKPVRAERLSAALDRVGKMASSAAPDTASFTPPPDAMAALPVETAGRTRYVRRSEVFFAEAHGDYVRLHTRSGAHVVRIPISRLEEYWEGHGFARVHRSFLLALSAVRELRSGSAGGVIAHTDLGDVPVSRRHARELRQRLLHNAQRSELGRTGRRQ
ncbi:LytTR family two component transcriptional regulator [Halopolyspora algeriensis]|uniref:LytTR family two component transcriptional regulator n=1 Tax=Halopolyspora algeriensis TaxID=1500506 RepID=A0A368VWB3_9ACTN|nr:LytTR family DNA-binding domain-containing protein [Halopolyspora algeriensis]RCW46133.1 LytTR family two component transcriptional regulator [Halopolyspora algeriensis]TQM55536.1 LytTR family two component transcriptional regulator [Halopolyspora algeriensis]